MLGGVWRTCYQPFAHLRPQVEGDHTISCIRLELVELVASNWKPHVCSLGQVKALQVRLFAVLLVEPIRSHSVDSDILGGPTRPGAGHLLPAFPPCPSLPIDIAESRSHHGTRIIGCHMLDQSP